MLTRLEESAPPRGWLISQSITDFKRFPFSNFTYYLTLFSRCFSSFLHSTCLLSVSCRYLALDGIYHPLWAAFPNNPTLRKCIVVWLKTGSKTGFSPSMTPHSRGLIPSQPTKTPPQTTILRRDYKFELFPLHSPLLGESLLVSFPPLINMLKFSGYSCLIWDQRIDWVSVKRTEP